MRSKAYFGYTNGTFGYVLSEDEWKYKGYEASVSVVTPEADRNIREAVLSHLQGGMQKLQPVKKK